MKMAISTTNKIQLQYCGDIFALTDSPRFRLLQYLGFLTSFGMYSCHNKCHSHSAVVDVVQCEVEVSYEDTVYNTVVYQL